MGKLVEEVKLWNTPIIGAYLLWQFSHGYCKGHPNGDAPVALLHFIALPILTNKELSEPITNKRDNLQSYARSFENSKNSDILLSIQERALDRRENTLAAIDLAISEALLMWDLESGKLYPREVKSHPGRGRALRPYAKRAGKKAEILGKWFSEHDLHVIETYLRVVF